MSRKSSKGGIQVKWLKRFKDRPETDETEARFPAEKRAHSRRTCQTVLRQIGYDLDHCHLITRTENLSEGGLEFISPHSFEPNEIIQLALTLNGPERSREVFFLGQIVWGRSDMINGEKRFRAGISILVMDAEDRQLLKDYLETLDNNPPPSVSNNFNFSLS